MLTPELLPRLGLFVVNGFFDAEWCARVRAELRAAECKPAPVYSGNQEGVDRSIRSTNVVDVNPATGAMVHARLAALQPTLESHFRVPLQGLEDIQCLGYRAGDCFRPHRDVNRRPDAPAYMQRRRVSLVLHINGESNSSDDAGYGGGSLTFYGLLQDSRWADYGIPLHGEGGLLVAFRSDVLHEVTPVTHGERFTFITWFF
jgi:SM-20-related protein